MKKSDVFKSRYIKAEDLGENSVTLTIESAEVDLIGPDKEEKMVIGFKGGKYKPLILNSTNWDLIEQATGQANSDKWPGKKITLQREKTRYRGQLVDCIRVVVPAGKGGKKSTADQADNVPF